VHGFAVTDVMVHAIAVSVHAVLGHTVGAVNVHILRVIVVLRVAAIVFNLQTRDGRVGL